MLAPNQPEPTVRDSRHFAVVTLALCFVLALLGRLPYETFTVYVLPISNSFGWDRAEILSVYSLAALATGLSGPLVGRLFDAAGPRAVYLFGLVMVGGGYLVGSQAQQLWHFQLSIGLACGLGAACLGNISASLVLARWFGPRLPSAMGVVFAGAGVALLALVPLAQWLVQRFEWRGAYEIIGAAFLIMALPIAFGPWRRIGAGAAEIHSVAKTATEAGDWTLSQALRQPAFWGLFSTFFFTGIGMFAVSVQMVPYLIAAGYSPLEAASYWGLSGIMMVVGLLSVPWIDGVLGRARTILISYGFTSAGLILLWLLPRYPNAWVLFGFLVLFGSTIGSRGPLVAATALKIFRGKRAGTIYGSIAIGAGVGPAVGSWMGGVILDVTQTYDWVIGFALLSTWIGMIPFLSLKVLRED